MPKQLGVDRPCRRAMPAGPGSRRCSLAGGLLAPSTSACSCSPFKGSSRRRLARHAEIPLRFGGAVLTVMCGGGIAGRSQTPAGELSTGAAGLEQGLGLSGCPLSAPWPAELGGAPWLKPCLLCPGDGQGITFPKALLFCGGVTAKPGIVGKETSLVAWQKKGCWQSRVPLGQPTKEQWSPNRCQAELAPFWRR